MVNVSKASNTTTPPLKTIIVPTAKEKPPATLAANAKLCMANQSEGGNPDTLMPIVTVEENTPLPPINHAELISPHVVLTRVHNRLERPLLYSMKNEPIKYVYQDKPVFSCNYEKC